MQVVGIGRRADPLVRVNRLYRSHRFRVPKSTVTIVTGEPPYTPARSAG